MGLLLATACVDGLPTDAGQPAARRDLRFSLAAPADVSAPEQDALGRAFDRVDHFHIQLFRPGEAEPFLDTLIEVDPGLGEYLLDLSVPEGDAERTLTMALEGLVGETSLFRGSAELTPTGDRATRIATAIRIRYTGPGVRGTVLDPDGMPATGVTVELAANGGVILSALTGEDGGYLFLDVQPGSYEVRVTTAPGVVSCPGQREINPLVETSSIVADFRLSRTGCALSVLVMTGGDVDDSGEVIAALSGSMPEAHFASTFVVVSPPSLAEILGYDVVLLFENGGYDNADGVGDRLAEYIAAGGNVVLGSFYWQNRSDGGFGFGGWGALEELDPFTSTGGAGYGPGSLGSVTPHAITSGVEAISVERWWGGVSAKSGTTVVASWADGTPLAGYLRREGGQRIAGISAFPGLAERSSGLALLYANALRWAGAAGGPARAP